MPPVREAVLDQVVDVVPALLHERFPDRRDLCVLGTRVGYDVCRYFEVDARPVVLRTLAYNAAWERAAAETDGDLADPRWEQAIAAGAHSVAIDERDKDEPGRYPGHVALYVPGDPTWLLDLTLGQFARPEKQMPLSDAWMYVVADPEGFIRGGRSLLFGAAESGYVGYRIRDDAPDFRRGRDWRSANDLSGQAIRRVRAALAEVPV